MPKTSKARRPQVKEGDLLKLRDAALELRVSFPTIKQWIYKRKIRRHQDGRGPPPHSAERGGPAAFQEPGKNRALNEASMIRRVGVEGTSWSDASTEFA